MSSLFAPIAPPKTSLGYHRILSPLAGVRVSPLCLGAMAVGNAWEPNLPGMNKEQSFKLLDAFYEAGGNFIDTAGNYQNEQSEEWLGEWMESRGVRDQIVLATKFTTNYKSYELKNSKHGIASNYGGNHSKSLHLSVRDSLKKLRTDYIDILYVHWWDYSTSVEELMRSLDAVVKSGKVLYLGASDIPAWIVSSANQYARCHAMTPFVVYQGLWNVMLRDFEREIIPMCLSEGMALAPWGAAGQGKFKSQAEADAREKSDVKIRSVFGEKRSEQEIAMSSALEKVAKETGSSITAVALAYCLKRVANVFPIIGGRKIEHLHDNIKALELELTQEQIKFLESQAHFEPGFPHNYFGEDPRISGETTSIGISSTANIKWVKYSPAVGPTKVPSSQ